MLRELVSEESGRLSTSDAFMLFGAGSMFTIWVGLGVGKLAFGLELDEDWFRWLTWGRDFMFLSMLPYLMKRVEHMRNGRKVPAGD